MCYHLILQLQHQWGGVFPIAGFKRNRQSILTIHENQKNTPIIIGHGIKDEIIPINEALNLIKKDLEYFNEDIEHNTPWELCNLISNYSAAITQSTTFAAEASIQNVPTLLISKAERGFLSELKTRNAPLIQCKSINDLDKKLLDWHELLING